MLEMGTSGLMSGEGKPPAASRSRTAPFLDSTSKKEGLQICAKLSMRLWFSDVDAKLFSAPHTQRPALIQKDLFSRPS